MGRQPFQDEASLKRFPAKAGPGLDPGWKPVRVKKTRQIMKLKPRFDSIETEKASRGCLVARVFPARIVPELSACTFSATLSRRNGSDEIRPPPVRRALDLECPLADAVRLVPKSELERARLIREARAIYQSIFPDTEAPKQPKRG
jgi:hypothetical protein